MRSRFVKFSALLIGATLAGSSLSACSSSPKPDVRASTAQGGVNSFLWRASLETLSDLPITQTDPFGGVIITDWYSNPKAPNERLKANIYILDGALRGDALKAAVFKQVRTGGSWQDAPIDADTARNLESTIFRRAAELYSGSTG